MCVLMFTFWCSMVAQRIVRLPDFLVTSCGDRQAILGWLVEAEASASAQLTS
jgi:hypothetical protein